jgi:hypothetical protein
MKSTGQHLAGKFAGGILSLLGAAVKRRNLLAGKLAGGTHKTLI